MDEAIEQELAEQLADVILLDCITLLTNNILLQLPENVDEQQASQTLNDEVDACLPA